MAFTDFSCVYYEEGDKLGKLLAYAALIPYVLILHHASRFYSRREIHEAVIVVAFVANEGIARGLKHGLRHPRPPATCAKLELCESFGMPSSHTQCIAFALMLHLLLFARHFGGKSVGTRLVEACEVLALAVATLLTAASRVYLGYHSVDQVAAGGLLGLGMGAVCFAVLGSPVWDALPRTRLGKLLHLRSSWDMFDPLHQEAAWCRQRDSKKVR